MLSKRPFWLMAGPARTTLQARGAGQGVGRLVASDKEQAKMLSRPSILTMR